MQWRAVRVAVQLQVCRLLPLLCTHSAHLQALKTDPFAALPLIHSLHSAQHLHVKWHRMRKHLLIGNF